MSNAQYYNPSEAPRRSRRDREYDNGSYAGTDDYSSSRRDPGQYDLIRRPREDSDSYVEDIQRDFPPAGYDNTYGRPSRPSNRRRASSLDAFDRRGAAAYADSRRDGSEGGSERGRGLGEKGSHKRNKSRAQEIAAAGVGAIIAAGGKELYDREREKKHPSSGRSKSKTRLATAGLGIAGAVAGAELAKYAIKQKDEHDGKSREGGERAKGSRRKSFGDAAMGMIGPAIASQDPNRNKYGSGGYGSRDSRGRGYDRDRSRSRSGRSGSRSQNESSEKIQQALKAALTAAAAEGWRSRDEPGGALSGEKLRRIVTAAVSAAGVDALVDKDPENHSSRNTIISALAGLLGNRVINGSRDADFGTRDGGRDRSQSRGRGSSYSRDGRDRGRSSSNGPGLGGLAGLGAAAAAGKALWDRSRSRKGERDQERRYSSDDERGYGRRDSERGNRRRSRSRSIVDRGLAKLGLGESEKGGRDRERGGSGDEHGRSRGGRRGGAAAGAAAGAIGSERRRSRSNSSSSSMDSDTEKKTRRKMRGKEYLTAGLATVATVNAAHEVYESMEQTRKRMKAVKEGKMSPEEARRERIRGHTKDAIALGLAGIGVKGAVDTWKETRETKHEYHEFDTKRAEHRRKREEREREAKSHIDHADEYVSAPIYDEPVGYAAPPVGGPVYQDGNPYSAGGGLPPPPPGPPPVSGNSHGYDDRRY